MPLLSELIRVEDAVRVDGSLATDVGRIVTDSREITPGDIFVCLPGYRAEGGETRADRHDFISAALERGAAALVVERPPAQRVKPTVVVVSDAWATVALMASRYHREPSRQLWVVGITGTSGKTSTSFLVESVLRAAGQRVCRLGTTGHRIGDCVVPAMQTTPEAPLLQSLLRQAVDDGCTSAVMEVSSHSLQLGRVSGVAFDVAVFTNLSHDHLNFHADMDDYRRAKGRLFEGLAAGGKESVGVFNTDDPASAYMRSLHRGASLTYGLQRPADVWAHDVRVSLDGVAFVAETPAGMVSIRLRHLGDYSVYNALAALAVGICRGSELDEIAAALASTPAVPGRFELVDAGQDFVVAVDYAHKPDALRRLLESAGRLGAKRVVTVFGCGGDRDRAKRPAMGRIAAELSDYTIVTSDNPRSEDPLGIVEEIVRGMRDLDPEANRYMVETDRARAIHLAILRARPGDLVLIAGKGHESVQIVQDRKLDFDDRAQALAALRDRSGG